MTGPHIFPWLLYAGLAGSLSPVYAQETGEAVRIDEPVVRDVYAAGGTVDILAPVDGDVVVAGGRVTLNDSVSGDAMAAGGAVHVHGNIGDDARLAGGDVLLGGAVGDDFIAAGGNVTLAPAGQVGGRAWLSGGRVEVAGSVGRELRAAGGRIVLSGRVDGNVELTGRSISILEGAVIGGNLIYRSPHAAEIAAGAQIRGTTEYEPIERPVAAIAAAVAGGLVLMLLSLIVTGGILLFLFPRLLETAVATIRTDFWKCLGLGLAIFAATPVVIGLLFMTIIGWLPAVVTGAVYLLLLLAGFLTGVFHVGRFGWRLRGRVTSSWAARFMAFVAALVLLTLLGLIPLIGALLLFAVMLLGTGALPLGIRRLYGTGA